MDEREQVSPVEVVAPARSRQQAITDRLAELARRRRVSFWVSVVQRFNEVDGGNQSVVLSVTLFTTVLPLMILSFGHASGFAGNVNVGTLFDREAGLSGAASDAVRAAFGTASGLRSSWSVIGLAGFLVCVGAVLWERSAPPTTVVEVEVEVEDRPDPEHGTEALN